MILLFLMQLAIQIVSFIFDLIIPQVPDVIIVIVDNIFNYISDGISILTYVFVDFQVIKALASWYAVVFIILLGIDIVWFVIKLFTLRRNENNGQ